MGDFASRSPRSERAVGAWGGRLSCRVEPARPAPTPAERALEAVAALDREAALLRDAVDRVRGAHAANDAERWTETRARLDGVLREAARVRERARAAAPDATAETAGRLAVAEGELEELAAAAGALTAPPAGIARLAREAELEAALAAPIEGSVAAGYQQKEARIRAEIDQLSPAESRVLAERLRRARPSDPLASLFGRMTADRRGRLLAYLDDARRREAVRAAKAPKASAPAPAAAAPPPAPSPASRSTPTPATPIGPAAAARRVLEAHQAKPDVAWAYVRANHARIVEAIGRRVATVALPAHERLAWVPGGAAAVFAEALAATLDGDQLFAQLPELIHPGDAWYVIDQNRRLVEGTPGRVVDGREPKGPLTWNPLTGDALAIEVAARVRESFARMAPRFAAQLDEKHPAPVTIADLVTSHPMDRVTARLLCDERVVRPVARKRGAAPPSSAEPAEFRDGLRILEDWRWLGEQDSRLWNWIEVRRPRDARAEDVAATLLHRSGAPPSHLAYGITAAPPFFRFDPPWARMLLGDAAPAPTGPDQPHRDDALALAESGLATEAAIAQAADERAYDARGIPLPPDLERLTELLERSLRQLERAKELLLPWKLWVPVLPALQWVAKHREHLLAIPDGRLVRLTPVIEGQQAILFEAVGAVQDVAAAGGRAASAEGDTGPITDVLRRYAVAIGESHLVDTARAQLATAREAKAGLTLALMDRSLREGDAAARELVASETPGMTYGGAAAVASNAAHHREVLALRGRHAAGAPIDPGDVELLAANLKAHALEAKARSLYLQLHRLGEEAGDAASGFFGSNTAIFTGAGSVRKELTAMAADLHESVIAAWAGRKAARLQELRGAQDKRLQAWAVTRAADDSQQALDAFVKRRELDKLIERAIRTLERQQVAAGVVKAVLQIALLIGVSVVGGVVGNVVAGAVRGALLADAAVASIGMMRVAQVAGRVAGLATDAAVNAAGQTVITSGSASDAWIDNFLSSGAVLIALRPLHNAAASWGAARPDPRALSLWERTGAGAKVALRAGAVLSAEMITGAAVAYLVHRARGKPPDDRTAATWAIEGASMAIGKFASLKLRGLETRLVALAEHGAHLRRRTASARKLADQVERTGDKDRAMELLAQHHRLLTDEASLLAGLDKVPGLRLTPETVATLRAGNRAERAAIGDRAFSTLPLRLAGLTPDDASGKVWAGSTEDLAIALHQASRAGLAVKVLDHDVGARQWRVRYNDEEITIVEQRLQGQPRAAKGLVTDADRIHARRYAEAAEFMQGQWEARTKAALDAREVIEIDHLQVGHSIAGVVNQATLPASGDGLGAKLVIYDHKGTLAGRGAQELGQHPSKWNAPGVRGSEQAAKDAAWITSEEHRRSLDIGRLEVQTPAYRGSVIKLERRPQGAAGAGADPWKAPHRAFRVQVRDAGGTARWFYADRVDNAGGMGPADLRYAKRVTDPHELEAMLATHQVLRGEDPDYASKVRPGEIFVWGGTPTGAWGAEPAARAPGTRATIMGDTAPATPSWPRLLEEHEAVTHAIATHRSADVPAELARRRQELEAQITRAHRGMALRRNRKPGATYAQGIRPGAGGGGRGGDGGDARIAFGTPSKIAPTPDGRVVVTVGRGADAKTTIYDQVVIAHGQDPGAPGAPGALLGPGAAEGRGPAGEKTYGEVPEGTIALRPTYGPRRDGREPDVLGLESVDPPGIRLIGAAYATKKAIPWVKLSERAGFERAIDRMAAEHAPTRDHGPVGEDSKGVAPGIEHQRDRIPRANEVLAARAYRLPGPEHTLELDRANPARWDDQVREFFAIHLRASGQWVKVQRLGGGRSKAVVYRVWVDDSDVGVFKLFDGKDGAANEQAMLRRLEQAKLKKMKAVKERGRMAVDPETGYEGGALLMDAAKGTSIKELIEHLPSDPALRAPAFDQLTAAMKRAAEGLAELHAKFETRGSGGAPVMMSKEAKLNDADYFLNNNFRRGADVARVKAALGDADFQRVRAALEGPVLQSFLDADVPATAYHGDANAGNFIVHDYTARTGYRDLGVIDVGSMMWSVDKNSGTGTRTGAADVARLLGSLESLHPGRLTPIDVQHLRTEFMQTYWQQYRAEARHDVDAGKHAQAEKWYRIEMEIAALKSDARAKPRIMQQLGLEASP